MYDDKLTTNNSRNSSETACSEPEDGTSASTAMKSYDGHFQAKRNYDVPAAIAVIACLPSQQDTASTNVENCLPAPMTLSGATSSSSESTWGHSSSPSIDSASIMPGCCAAPGDHARPVACQSGRGKALLLEHRILRAFARMNRRQLTIILLRNGVLASLLAKEPNRAGGEREKYSPVFFFAGGRGAARGRFVPRHALTCCFAFFIALLPLPRGRCLAITPSAEQPEGF